MKKFFERLFKTIFPALFESKKCGSRETLRENVNSAVKIHRQIDGCDTEIDFFRNQSEGAGKNSIRVDTELENRHRLTEELRKICLEIHHLMHKYTECRTGDLELDRHLLHHKTTYSKEILIRAQKALQTDWSFDPIPAK